MHAHIKKSRIKMNRIRIKFKGLKEGRYNYHFKIDDSFFAGFKETDIKKAEANVEAEMIIAKDLITFNFIIQGKISVQCDRCLDYFWQEINYQTELYVEFGDDNSDLSDADKKIVLSNNENEIVLDKHIYDYIHLSLPYQRIHPKNKNGSSTCNIEMINKLEEINSDIKQETDPRWDKLKNLYN